MESGARGFLLKDAPAYYLTTAMDRGWPLPPAKRAEHDRTVAAAREALGEEVFAAAWARGHALPLEETVTDTLNSGQ